MAIGFKFRVMAPDTFTECGACAAKPGTHRNTDRSAKPKG